MPTTVTPGVISDPQPFDVVFDNTFRALVLITPSNPVAECRQRGVYITWLSKRGWPYWLFEGKITKEKEVLERNNTIFQAGIERSIQKEYGDILTIRTIGLTESLADFVGTVYDSSAVYIVLTDADGITYHLPVKIDAGSFLIWQQGKGLGVFEVRIKLPKTRSQRT